MRMEEPMRLYLLLFGVNSVTGTPYPGYLIRTADGTNVLVDTGIPDDMLSYYLNPADIHEEYSLVSQLATLGLTRQNIHYLIATHLDDDHVGHHDLFPDAEIVIQRTQLEVGRRSERFQRNRTHWDAPGLHYRAVDGDTELLPGIELIESSGHVPGHQAVLVRLPQTGPVLLTIDAISRSNQRDPDTRPVSPFDMDEASTRASTRKLMELAERERVTLLIYGHDADQWKSLKVSPDFYG
jgi:N-acyl homoserine lactone hydrolase